MPQTLGKLKSWWLRHIGRRGSALQFFALLNAYYSWGLLTLPPQAKLSPAFLFIDGVVPVEVWSLAFGISSLLCLVCSFRRWDGIAFAATIAIYLLWGIIYLAGDIAGEIYRGSVSAALFFALSTFVGLISGWPEVPGGDKWETLE